MIMMTGYSMPTNIIANIAAEYQEYITSLPCEKNFETMKFVVPINIQCIPKITIVPIEEMMRLFFSLIY